MSNKVTFISIVIPCRNSKDTLRQCLKAAFSSDYDSYEVIVVDDGSEDDSIKIARTYPVKLIDLGEHRGVSETRNTGVDVAEGEVILFIDSDCLIDKRCLGKIDDFFRNNKRKALGGTYTPVPFDRNFFSIFQSLYVNYCESEKKPDYLATHCLAIRRKDFISTGGFIKNITMGHTTSVEDVEFSHRLGKYVIELVFDPELQVKHIFNFNLLKSLRNATKKSYYWTLYSLNKGDLFKDSGASSHELKISSTVLVLSAALVASGYGVLSIPLYIFNIFISRGLISQFNRYMGGIFTLKAMLYFYFLYPLPVISGGLGALLKYSMLKLRGEI
ncbi:poly-beta-1,6-N-acetyl-D-glucosamine synthase [archaeon]|nr:poly-beta-1,6-N-acetyl-D-glucosamine synthase [archaeon]